MKTYINQFEWKIKAFIHPKIKFIPKIMISLIAFMYSNNNTIAYAQSTEESLDDEPELLIQTPDLDKMVRYYYFPVIECFYDVLNENFVYPQDNKWIISATLPPRYEWFDISIAFVIPLDYSYYKPWLNFENYISTSPLYSCLTVNRTMLDKIKSQIT